MLQDNNIFFSKMINPLFSPIMGNERGIYTSNESKKMTAEKNITKSCDIFSQIFPFLPI